MQKTQYKKFKAIARASIEIKRDGNQVKLDGEQLERSISGIDRVAKLDNAVQERIDRNTEIITEYRNRIAES